MLNNRQRFIALAQEANRSTCTFYPPDARGLAVFDSSMGDRDERMQANRGESYNKQSGTLPGTMMGDRRTPRRAPRLPAAAGRQHRRARRHQHQRPRCRRGAHRARPVVLLPAWVLLGQREPRRQVADDQGPRQAPRCRRARPQGLSRAPRRGHGRPDRDGARRGRRRRGRRRRRIREHAVVGRPRVGHGTARRTTVAQPGRVLLPRRRGCGHADRPRVGDRRHRSVSDP